MHFDDRLATVLGQRAGSDAIERAQYRQLLDLLGTLPASAHSARIDEAYLRLAELSESIPAPERAAMLAEPALRLRSPRLVSQLALSQPPVPVAALKRAELAEDQWLDLIPALPVGARGLARHRRDLGPQVEALLARLGISDRGLPASDQRSATEPPSDSPPQIDQIGAIVRRIEAFRKTRAACEADGSSQAAAHAAVVPPSRPLDTIDIATDAEGRIVWADAAAAPATVGLRLASREADGPVQADPALMTALRHRQPIVAQRLTVIGAAAVAGDWQLDAAPRFDQPGGRFAGYLGRLRRPAPDEHPTPPASAEADRMRQILHELRTPVNAIQGFAEVIQQQLYGPAPHEYRALAATIASDAARMLAGFDELDRLAKLSSGAMTFEPGQSDLAAIIAATIAQLHAYADPRRSGFDADVPEEPLPVALPAEEAQRLVWRLLATLAAASAPGEVLRLRVRRRSEDGNETIRLTLRLPMSLAICSDEALFHAGTGSHSPALATGLFGAGFALRLARAEAQAGGGALDRREERLRLTLPAPSLTRSQQLQADR